jgi:hypothetical protein
MYFFHQFHLLIQKLEKRIKPLDLWVEGRILTISSHVFSLKLLCRKDTYNVNHCAGTIKKIHFFSCWALYCKYVEPNATFNLLLLFSLNLLYSTSIMLMII